MCTQNILLKTKTNFTSEGPRILIQGNEIAVDYDYIHENGDVEWNKIIFQDAITFEYRDNICTEAESIIAFDKVRCLSQSDWLFEVISIWEKSLGNDKYQQTLGGQRDLSILLYGLMMYVA